MTAFPDARSAADTRKDEQQDGEGKNRGWQPQIRYAPTTNQTKRLSEPAQVDQGKPSARAACAPSKAVWTSQPTRTPQVASRPASPGWRTSFRYATAASL